MRRRRWVTWLVFGLCALLVVDVLGWATWRVLGLERAERLASARADAGRRERLALWQMDSLVSAVVARESARPYFVYRPRYAADRPYDRAWALDDSGSVRESPLASGTGDALIRLHYQIETDETIISPQAGSAMAKELGVATAAPETLRAGRLLRELESKRSTETAAVHRDRVRADVKGLHRSERRAGRDEADDGGIAPPEAEPETLADSSGEQTAEPAPERGGQTAAVESPPADEGDARLRRQLFDIARQGFGFQSSAGPASRVEVGPFRPRWIHTPGEEPELVFERAVRVGDESHTQGFWIDWPSLRAELLAAAVRLVPDAALEPVRGGDGPGVGVLATIPLRLVAPDPAAALPASTPTRVTLAVTWVAALTALAAIGLVLRAATRLADRRGRFVAVVTHELRSPLTSFRLHTDLLRAGGDDPEARARYIDVLGRESARLASVVENVLAYAGLTRGRADAPPARLGDLLDPLLPTLAERVERAGGELVLDLPPDAEDAAVRTAPGAIERILVNLVDNACRYAVTPETPAVRLSADRAGGSVRVRVSDRGPGVRPAERDRIFGDFTRGAEAGRSPEGMGLGLTLARGLARASGGELRLVRTTDRGATFELVLPEHRP